VLGSDFEPVLGLPSGELCSFVGALSCPTLLCGTLVLFSLSQGVLFSELGAFVKRFGGAAQRRCQAFGGLPVTTCCALNYPLALGSLALVRGPLSMMSRFHATSPLLEPTYAVALRFLLV
jgi:hypothetical protein